MKTEGGGKSVKEKNRRQLWLAIALNALVFVGVVRWETMTDAGWREMFTAATNLLPIGFALLTTTVANGLMSATTKARLVFVRWKNALPGHRAFSTHGACDPRVDMDRIKKSMGNKLPAGPEEENKAWYRIFKEVEAAPEVELAHREFLLMRDYAAFSAIFLIVLGGTGVAVMPTWSVALGYAIALLTQFIVVRHAAKTYGERFVCTVLAVKSAKLNDGVPRKAKAPEAPKAIGHDNAVPTAPAKTRRPRAEA